MDEYDIRQRLISRLHDAIMERDRDQALIEFRELFPDHPVRTVEQQRRLYPDRTPA